MTNSHQANGPYEALFKRPLDFLLSLTALVLLSPLLVVLSALGAVKMQGNPFFTQERPGWHERVFKLIKFRTMSNARDTSGNLLPDGDRLNAYGKFLRSTSLDELPELINILKGDMALVGPRPLLTKYLPRYNREQKHRHDVRPGLTGWAQVNGRNTLSWEDKFRHDVWYVQNISLALDLKILFMTVRSVLRHEGISAENSATMEEFMGTPEAPDISTPSQK